MRNHSGEILRAVAAGESVQVTNHGHIAAVISPPGGDTLAQLQAQNQLRPALRPVTDLARLPRRAATRTSEEILSDTRGRW
jgi:antitoxin (DNA-binding transcriptional repressor) of toxin-antitoxin stability system